MLNYDCLSWVARLWNWKHAYDYQFFSITIPCLNAILKTSNDRESVPSSSIRIRCAFLPCFDAVQNSYKIIEIGDFFDRVGNAQ